MIIAYWLGIRTGTSKMDQYWQDEMPNQREDAIMRSRAVLGGHFTENLAPFLPDFPFLPNECRFVGKPVDFIVFRGADEKNIKEVIFVEVKSGKSQLSAHELNLKETIDNKRVRFVEYRIPEELTKKGDIKEKISSIVQDISTDIKKFLCESCGRTIKHRGNCLLCNIKTKK